MDSVEASLSNTVGADHSRPKPLLVSKQVDLVIAEAMGVPEKERLRLDSSVGSGTPEVILRSPVVWDEGERIKGSFLIRLDTDADNVVFQKVDVDPQVIQEFRRGDFIADMSAVADPPYVSTSVEESAVVEVKVDIEDGVRFKPSWSSGWRAMRQLWAIGTSDEGSGEVTGSVGVVLTISTEDSMLKNAFLQRWNTDDRQAYFYGVDPDVQQRIYHLSGIWKGSVDQSKPVTQSQVAEIVLDIKHPWWAPLAALVPLGASVGLLSAGAWVLTRRRAFELEPTVEDEYEFRPVDTSGSSSASDADDEFELEYADAVEHTYSVPAWKLMTTGHPVSASEGTGARLRWIPLAGWSLAAAKDYRIDGEKRRRSLGTGSHGSSVFRIAKMPGPEDAEGTLVEEATEYGDYSSDDRL